MMVTVKQKQVFKEFTQQSIVEIDNRLKIEKELEAERLLIEAEENNDTKKKSAVAELVDKILGKKKRKKRTLNDRRPNKELLTGNTLPDKLKNQFPPELAGKPIEDLDEFYRLQHVFVVINKSKAIFRFNSKNAIYLLSPFNPLRRLAIYILTHPIFSAIVMLTILVNCIFMALPAELTPDITETIFTAIYSFEALIKILARGFILDPFSFLRDAWNWLDFIVICLAYATMLIKSLGNMSVLRTLRVLRALKTVAIVPGLKTIVDALVQSVFRLRDVMILTTFVLSVFALIGLQLYMGVLRRKCVYKPDGNFTEDSPEYKNFTQNEANWVISNVTGTHILCGISSLARQCDAGSICIAVGLNPNSGYTSFDSYPYAMLASFRLMTQDYWENLYALILTAEGPVHFFYFAAVIFFGSFYLINLILAIVALSYREQQEKAAAEAAAIEERRKLEEEENAAELEALTNPKLVEEKDIRALDSCSTHFDEHDQKQNGKLNDTNGNLCYISDNNPASNPINEIAQQETPIRHRNGSTSTQLTWNYDKKTESARSNQVISIPYADDTSSINTQATLKASDQQQHADILAIDDEKTGDNISIATITLQPKSAATLAVAESNSIAKNTNACNGSHNIEEIRSANLSKKSFEEVPDNSCKGKMRRAVCAIFCTWDCWSPFVKFQKIVQFFILDAFVDLFITLCILLNTLFMAMDHHDMDETFAAVLTTGNYVFTAIFAAEAFFKIIALTPSRYFKEGWNVFDIIIVALSLVELGLQGVKGLSVLRSFRLLRVFKLAKSWPTLNRLITIIGRTVGALGNLTFVLVIIIFIFAVVGMQLFGQHYVDKKDVFGGEVPRWSFVDFVHSFMIVFRVLCGEWIESMWDCLNVVGWPCVLSFYALRLSEILWLVVLNLFLALLLSSFSSDQLQGADSEDADVNKIQEAINRIARFINFIKDFIRRKICICCKRKKEKKPLSDANATSKTSIGGNSLLKTGNDAISIFIDEAGTKTLKLVDQLDTQTELQIRINADTEQALTDAALAASDAKEKDIPMDCFEPKCYKRFAICCRCVTNEDSAFAKKWAALRYHCNKISINNNFEMFIIVMIVLSSIALALEDKFIHEKVILKQILEYGDKIFTIIFTAEMLLKWVGFGFRKYFSDGWCWLDFIIVSVACLGLFASLLGYSDIQVFKTMRTLRALRPLRALSRFDGIKVVVNALIGSIPSVFNVMVVCLVFWLIFSIMGVQLFAGKFYKCVYQDNTRLSAEDEVQNKTECLAKGYKWYNSRINFDNTLNAYLALLQVATFKGWIEIIADATDIAPEPYLQPRREQNLAMLGYFVLFIIFGSFFTLNLFIGVIIDNFNQQKKKLGGSSIDLFLTESQKKYYQAMKKMGTKKPQKALPRPKFPLSRFLFDVTSNQKFDIFIMVCIFLNMIAMCLEHYDQSAEFDTVLTYVNYLFIAIFTVESAIKLIALHWRYFKIPWNVFDFIIVIFSILGIAFENVIKSYLSVSPTVLRVVRVARVGRVLRLVKGAKGIRTLLFALAISLPALVNIGLLLFLIIFIYAIFGMNFFMHVGYSENLTKEFNFETIYRSLITLFPLVTSGGWSTLLDGITHEGPPKCDPTIVTTSQLTNGDCGSRMLAIPFLVTFVVMTFLVVINMYIAVILENFNQAREEVQQGLTDDDYDMYYELWQTYDPNCTEFISYDKLTDFVDALEPPLRIPKPNKYKIISMNLTICEGNKIHCTDILDALTKNYLGTDDEPDPKVEIDLVKKKEQRPRDYQPLKTTIEKQREEYCAWIITKAVRKHLKEMEKKKIEIKRHSLSIANFDEVDEPKDEDAIKSNDDDDKSNKSITNSQNDIKN